MAIVTTYVCDVSGVSGTDRKDFCDIEISNKIYSAFGDGFCSQTKTDKRIVHKDVAKRLGLTFEKKEEAEKIPEVTFESKLKTLLQDWVGDLVQADLENRN